ncbi:hypothetical protein [Vibrio mediterranei]|uniref:hypothetical protein n=1 Tax=Vibrio mediterranei TaxID=689 RepID=UPI00406979C6
MKRNTTSSVNGDILRLLKQRVLASVASIQILLVMVVVIPATMMIIAPSTIPVAAIILSLYVIFAPSLLIFLSAKHFFKEIEGKPAWGNLHSVNTTLLAIALTFIFGAVMWAVQQALAMSVDTDVENPGAIVYLFIWMFVVAFTLLWSLCNAVFTTQSYFALFKGSQGVVQITPPVGSLIHRYKSMYVTIVVSALLFMITMIYGKIWVTYIFALVPVGVSLLVAATLAYDSGARPTQKKRIPVSKKAEMMG